MGGQQQSLSASPDPNINISTSIRSDLGIWHLDPCLLVFTPHHSSRPGYDFRALSLYPTSYLQVPTHVLAFPPPWQEFLWSEALPFQVCKYIELHVDGNRGGNARLWWHHDNPGVSPKRSKPGETIYDLTKKGPMQFGNTLNCHNCHGIGTTLPLASWPSVRRDVQSSIYNDSPILRWKRIVKTSNSHQPYLPMALLPGLGQRPLRFY